MTDHTNEQPQLELVSDGGHTPVAIDFAGFFTDHHRTIASALALTLRDDQLASDATAEAMDEEARAIVDAAYERTLALIRERKHEVEQVAKLLIERETITHDDMVDLVGDRPYEGDDQYKEYVSAKHQNEPEEKKEEDSSSEDKDDVTANESGGFTPGLA